MSRSGKRRKQRRNKHGRNLLANAGTQGSFRIEGSGSVDIAAAEGENKKPRFSSVAYTGGMLRLAGKPYPVVVDLASASVTQKSRPVLRDHDESRIVGHTDSIQINTTNIEVSGTVSGENEHSREVVLSAHAGFPWQQSIGARSNKMELVREGKTVQVNGQTFEGPLLVARNAVLKEVSFVALGADDDSTASVAASATSQSQGDFEMGFEQWLQAKGFDADTLTDTHKTSLKAMYDAEQSVVQATGTSTNAGQAVITATSQVGNDGASADGIIEAIRAEAAAETERVAAINAIVARHDVTMIEVEGSQINLAATAIKEGWTTEKTELHALKASRPTAPAGHSVAPIGDDFSVVIEAAALQATGYNTEKLEQEFSDQILQAAHTRYKGRIGLQEVFLECAWNNGYHGRSFRGDHEGVIRAAFSNLDISGILSNIANKFARRGFDSVESTWRAIASITPVTDFKQITRYSLTGDLTYQELGKEGQIKHGSLGEETYTNQADTYARMLSVSRADQINDDLGVLSQNPMRLGRGGALKLCLVFWTEFMNNAAFFTSDRNNYAGGVSTALSIDSLSTAEQMFFDQTDPDGNPLGIVPAILLVTNGLNVTASTLMNSTEVRDTTANKKTPTSNPHAGKFRVVRSSYLSNSNIVGNSALAWHLLADPRDLPVVEVVFLNGREQPTIESADANFNTLGVDMRGYHDFGVSKQEHRAGVKMKGEA